MNTEKLACGQDVKFSRDHSSSRLPELILEKCFGTWGLNSLHLRLASVNGLDHLTSGERSRDADCQELHINESSKLACHGASVTGDITAMWKVKLPLKVESRHVDHEG